MKAGRFINRWSFLAAILAVIIITGGVFIGTSYHPAGPIEIIVSPNAVPEGKIYVNGEVNNPGIYPFYAGDTFTDIVHAAGGVTDNADLSHVELDLPGKAEAVELQKININTAAAWLLAALPGIGETRAEAIIAYRDKNGPFRDVNELLNVGGIGTVTLQSIRDLITVGN